MLYDSSRGVGKYLHSDTTAAEDTSGTSLSAFNSDGFQLSDNGTYLNASGGTYVAWNWKLNGATTSSNATGDITSTVQVDPSGGFSIFTYTGSGSSGDTVAHGLSQAPTMTIIKQRNSTNGWNVWATGYNNGDYDSFGELNTGSAWNANQGANGPFTAAPGATLLTLTAYGQVNGSSNTYVGYAFSDIAGYCKSGSYTGNANTDGPFVYLGFKPAWLMVRYTGSGESWVIVDNKRDGYNPTNKNTRANGDVAEASGSTYDVDLLSNGFKPRTTWEGWNGNTYNIIYLAFAENPFKYATAR